MKKAIYFNQVYNDENPSRYSTCLIYDPVKGLSLIDDRKEISITTSTDLTQSNEIQVLTEKIEKLEKTITVMTGGGVFETETEYITNTIPADGTITVTEKAVDLFSYKPAPTEVKEVDITGSDITISEISIPTIDVNITGSLFDLNSKSGVTIKDSTINTTSTMTSVFTINAGTGASQLSSRSVVDGTVKISGIDLKGGIKTSNTNIWNLDKSTAVEIKDCDFNLSGYNGIMIGQNHDGILPKTIDIENCTFNTNNGKLNMFAISIFATQDDAVINIKNCTFRDVTACIRFGNSTAASGVIVNIENCHFANIDLEVVNGGFMSFENFQSANEYTKPERLTNETKEEYAARCCLEMLKYDDEVNRFGGGKMTINFINCTYGKEEIKPFNFPKTEYINILGSATDKQFIYMVNWCYSKKHGNTNVTNTVYPSYEAITTDADGNVIYPEYITKAWGETGKPVNVGPDCWPTINITYNK